MNFSALIVRTSGPVPLFLWGAIGLAAGIYLFLAGFHLLKKRQLILNTPFSKVRSASLGLVELSGLAVGPYTIPAPVTGRTCYFYRTLVWEWKQSGKNKQWVRVAAECMHVPFFLDDNSGKVMIDPREAELDLHRDFQQEFCDSFFTTKQEVPPNVHALLSRHGIMTTNKIKVEEFCIKPKNSLFILGTLAENPGITLSPQPIADDAHHTLVSVNPFWSSPIQSMGTAALSAAASVVAESCSADSSVSERMMGGLHHDHSIYSNSGIDRAILEEEYGHAAAARAIRLSPEPPPAKVADMTQQQKIAAALTKAGISNPAAWAAAGVTAAIGTSPDSFATPTPSLDGFEPCPATVIMKGKNDANFLISWRSQRDVASSLRWKCTLMIWGGPAIALLSFYLLLTLAHLI